MTDERISVAADLKTDGVQVRQRRLENLVPTQRNKSVAEDRRRYQICRRHRGHHGPAKPLRLIGPITQIRAYLRSKAPRSFRPARRPDRPYTRITHDFSQAKAC
jgi:hypothetical protein